jgi:hypothetical protein
MVVRLAQPCMTRGSFLPLVLEEKVMHCNIFFWVLTKLSWPRSLYSTRDELSESRFRAVQCYDDPTVAG